MSRSGPFSYARTGWMRRALSTGRYLWGPPDPNDGLLIGANSRNSPLPAAEQVRMFFDKSKGAIRSGLATGAGWDDASTGLYSAAFGANSAAIGQASFATGNSTASAINSVAMGQASNASGLTAFAVGGGLASGSFSCAIGDSAAASAQDTFAFGRSSGATRRGQWAYASGAFSSADAQVSMYTSRATTSNATPTEVAQDASTSYITIGATRTMSFEIKIAAHRTDVSGTAAAWPSISGAITRDSSGNCRLLGTVTGAGTTTFCDAGGSTWSVAVTADSTNNRLAITVTGEAAKTIRWLASTLMAEVG